MLVPIGVYRARAVEATLSSTSAKGTEHVQALFEIVDGGFEGQYVAWYGFFTPVTAKRTIESLRYCGWRGCDLADLEGVTENDVAIEIEHTTWEGRAHAKVAWVHHVSRLTALAPMPRDEAKAFAERMRGFVLSLRRGGTGALEEEPVRGGDTQRVRRLAEKKPDASPAGDEVVPFGNA